jgi:cell division protein FtsW
MADDREYRTRPSLSRQLLPAVHGLLARPLSSYYLLIASSGLLLLIGLTMVFSATSVQAYAKYGNAFSAITNQSMFALLGLLAFWVCQRLPTGTLRYLGKYILGAAIVLLVILDLIGALRSVHVLGAKQGIGPIQADLLWLYLGPIGLQPAELAKLGMVLWGADVIARKGPALGHWRELARPLFPMVGLLFVLVGYNDLGTMLVLLALIVGLLWAAGVRLRVFGALGVLGLAGVGLLIAAASGGAGSGSTKGENYRFARLTSFLEPIDKCDMSDNCYQLIQARSAIFEGGWFGVGLGKGALKWGWLPEGDNDFIFGVIAEELGVVGCAVVLALFAVLAYTGFRIARRSADPFRRLAATAITTWLVAQAVINIGGVTGMLPITGLPLPFISRGGSALVVTLAAIGMLASFARAEPDAARALNARPPARWVRLLWAPLPPVPPPRRQGSSRPPAQTTGRAPAGSKGRP